MKNKVLAAVVASFIVLPGAGPARAVERSEVAEQYRWELSALYADEAAWVAAGQSIGKQLPALARWQGKLGESPATLLAALGEWEAAYREVDRYFAYAMQLSDQDTRVARNQQMAQQAAQVYSELQTATAYMRPEILAIGRPTIERFIAEEPRLAQYRMFLDDILRAAPHTLTPPEEKVLARAGLLAQAGGAVHSVFTNADLPYPEVTLSTGEKVRLDASAYGKYRASPVKADRDAVFAAFWGRYGEFTRTLATTLNAHVESHVFNRDVRKFGSSLEAALFEYNIPVSVYQRLIDDVHANLPTLHRYLRLRQKIMGLPSLGYEDLYAPIVERVQLDYTPEQAMALTLDAFAPLGPEYVDVLRKGYASRWVDFLPTTGKRTGAYSTSVYDAQPFQLLNFNGAWEDVSTLAHESGHSMHSYLSAKHQPYATAGYSIFVAEVASTLNENLLLHHMLGRAKDDDTRLALLGSHLDADRGTLFRQTQFADFELAMHEKAERGEPLTGENLTELYLRTVREYYGHDRGVTQVDDLIGAEWAFIPHFYRPFYVYQYATSLVASIAIARAMREEAKEGRSAARDAYLDMLRAGGSKYPVELLRGAGVDVLSSGPFDAAMAEMNGVMDEMEAILARRG